MSLHPFHVVLIHDNVSYDVNKHRYYDTNKLHLCYA